VPFSVRRDPGASLSKARLGRGFLRWPRQRDVADVAVLKVAHFTVDTRPGKHRKNYGKSPFLMGKLTINGNFQ